MAEIFKVYAAYATIDEYGARAAAPVVYTRDASIAKSMAEGRGCYGGDGQVVEARAIRVNGNVYLLASDEPIILEVDLEKRDRAIREKALAKLTPEEIAVLKIKI